MIKNGQYMIMERQLFGDWKTYNVLNIFEKVLGEPDTWNEIL